MSFPLSSVVANIFIESFETKAVETSVIRLNVWLWCDVDTIIVRHHGKSSFSAFLNHLYDLNKDI